MKLIAAQLAAHPGDIPRNLDKHRHAIEVAAGHGADCVFFPELSLTGYEPHLAEQLAMLASDQRLDVLQTLSDQHALVIGVGVPLVGDKGTEIGMVIFQPAQARSSYSKMHLHAHELPFFVPGKQQRVYQVKGQVLAPAICFESLQPEHAQQAAGLGAQVYVASVAKSAKGVLGAYAHYPQIASELGMTVMMANCIGPADNFVGAGQSGVWNPKGERLCSADADREVLLAYDLQTGIAALHKLA
ncbi:carbon-nitrogen hydrolase family protein [Pseudomonas sp. nanlin1]|uniref:carbon-nitrogen hydrolase family protein n=1 Tax=Pseudomonas sp. nanlin1 TaxID=3040605 RepID=UPI00388D9D38